MLKPMKPRLATTQQQQLTLTPQLRQSIHLLQLSTAELEAEIAEAVASNPLLDWVDDSAPTEPASSATPATATPEDAPSTNPEPPWGLDDLPTSGGSGRAQQYTGNDIEADYAAPADTLRDHLLWQLHLGHFSPRERHIGVMLIDAIDDNGYLREALDDIGTTLELQPPATPSELARVLTRIQQFDPVGVGARDLSECLRLQLHVLPDTTPGRATALRIAGSLLEQLPRLGLDGVRSALACSREDAEQAIALLRGLAPRPGTHYGELAVDTYVTPDCLIWKHQGRWQVALAKGAKPRVDIQRDYQRMIQHATPEDADYLHSRLQEARWLLKAVESRADTLLRVVQLLVREQSGFLEFGPQALRPLTLRNVADELGLHESTISRAVARKYARTVRGTLALRDFFAVGVDTGDGTSTANIAIQDRIRQLIQNENPRKPLSDARLADTLKAEGIPVARRTVAKYREALQLPASHERVRIG